MIEQTNFFDVLVGRTLPGQAPCWQTVGFCLFLPVDKDLAKVDILLQTAAARCTGCYPLLIHD
jgi:hypothetical protein